MKHTVSIVLTVLVCLMIAISSIDSANAVEMSSTNTYHQIP